jgi:predicted AAA+ superfamily ATPase
VFSDTTRDDVLNLSDLIEGKIDVAKFFNENFKTKGMEILLDTAFKRVSGKSGAGVIKLTQAMGGGKTHNMLALALLAQNPDWREKIVGRGYNAIGEIKVVAFSGRESDAEFGIWGSIAEQLKNVCLVFSDLRATYESGSQLLSSSFKELENEANRTALNLEPVALNTDEVYDILRKRLFASYPSTTANEVNEIAIAYKDALVRAGKSGLTGHTGDAVYLGVKDSYPFHPSIKEIYARFKENPGFQQTRGLIRLMRQVVRGFYESGGADKKVLIAVQGFRRRPGAQQTLRAAPRHLRDVWSDSRCPRRCLGGDGAA